MAKEELELREATRNLRFATEELRAFNQSVAAEIGGLVAKDLKSVTEKFTAGFMQVPGVQTLGAVGKTLFNRGFAKLKEKREERLLREQLGITKMEFDQFKKTEKVRKAQQDANDKLKAGAESLLGFDVKLEKSFEKIKMSFDPINSQFRHTAGKLNESGEKIGGQFASVEQALSEQQMGVAEMQAIQYKQLESSQQRLKLQGETGELHKEHIKLQNGIEDSIMQMVENQEAMQQQNLTGTAKQQEIVNEEARANKRQENVFKKIAGNLGFLKDSAEEGDGEKKGFFGSLISKIGGFATQIIALPAMFVALKASLVAFGVALAPLAVPIAIGAAALTGFVAFIKGFIEGFGEGGFFGGVKEGLMELFDWFVGFPLRLLKNLTTFVLRFLGFDALADDIDAAFEPFLAALRGIFGVLTDVITVPIVAVGRTITGMFEGLFDILMAPINAVLTALTGVFDGIGTIIDGISMLFSGDIMGGLQMIFSGIIDTIMAPIDGLIVFISEVFGGLFTIVSAPFKAIYDTLGDLFFNPTSTVASIISFITETFGEFFELITRPFRGLYDLVVGIFTFDLEQIGDGIFKLVGGLFDIVTAPFRAIFDLISSIFDFDFMAYLETLPGFGAVIGVVSKGISAVTGIFTSNEEEDKAKAERDAAAKRARQSKEELKRAEQFERAAMSGNVTINGQVATPEQRAEIIDRAQGRRLSAQVDFAGADLDLANAQEKYVQVMDKMTLPELVTAAGDKMGAALFGANENLVAKMETEKEAALARQEAIFEQMNRSEEFISEETIAAKMQAIRDEHDAKIQGELDKGLGLFRTVSNFMGGIFDFDFMGMIKSIPGAEKVLNFLGFGPEQSIASQIQEAEDRIARSEAGENVYFGGEAGGRNRDRQEIERLLQEQRELDTEGGVAPIIIQDNSSRVTTSSNSSTVQMRPVRDTTPPVGTLATVGVF